MRQYIGARYVPRFVGVYDNTQSYEALDVVDNGSGTSYIAKKPTPANTPLTDTDFWFLYGSTNGAILNLQQQVDELRDDLDFTNESLQGESGAGDSMLIADSFGANLESVLQNTYNFTITYSGTQAGIGFKNDEFIGKMNTLATGMSDDDKAALKYVIVIGGCNDTKSGYMSTLPGKVTAFCTQARALFPNARILIGYAATLYDAASIYTDKTYKAIAKRAYLEGALAANVGAEFIDHLVEVVSDCYYALDSDRVHPSLATGAVLLADVIIQAIRKQNVSIPNSINISKKSCSNTSNGITFSMDVYFCNDGEGKAKMIIPAQQIASGSITLADGVSYTWLTFADLPLSPYPFTISKHLKLSTGDCWIELDHNGLTMFGGFGTSIAGTYTDLRLRDSIEIDLPLYN